MRRAVAGRSWLGACIRTHQALHFLPSQRPSPHLLSPPTRMSQVDFKKGALAFRVGINGAEPVPDMKALSGGERSLSSLAFILALGACSRPAVAGGAWLQCSLKRVCKRAGPGSGWGEAAPELGRPACACHVEFYDWW